MKSVVILPCLNEEKTLEKVINELRKVGSRLKLELIIIGIDDASEDNSLHILNKNCEKVISFKKKVSLAEVIRSGLKEAIKFKPGIIIHIDTDNQYKPSELAKLIKPIKLKQANLVIGYRKVWQENHIPILKKIGNTFFTRLVSIIIKEKVHDAQSGFRVLDYEFANNLKLTSKHTYTQEEIIRAKQLGYKIKQIPISFKDRKHGESRLINNIFNYGFNVVIDLIRIITQGNS